MTFTPLLQAPALFQFHAFLALGALVLGAVQLAAPKGTIPHRVVGYVWLAMMAAIALSSFGIRALRHGQFSFVHIISIFTLIVMPLGVMHARRGRIARHRVAMISLYCGALIIAGAFTLVPGRIMNHVVFGMLGNAAAACG